MRLPGEDNGGKEDTGGEDVGNRVNRDSKTVKELSNLAFNRINTLKKIRRLWSENRNIDIKISVRNIMGDYKF